MSTGELVSQISNTRKAMYRKDRDECVFFNDSVRVASVKIDEHVVVREYIDNVVCSIPSYTGKFSVKHFCV